MNKGEMVRSARHYALGGTRQAGLAGESRYMARRTSLLPLLLFTGALDPVVDDALQRTACALGAVLDVVLTSLAQLVTADHRPSARVRDRPLLSKEQGTT